MWCSVPRSATLPVEWARTMATVAGDEELRREMGRWRPQRAEELCI